MSFTLCIRFSGYCTNYPWGVIGGLCSLAKEREVLLPEMTKKSGEFMFSEKEQRHVFQVLGGIGAVKLHYILFYTPY